MLDIPQLNLDEAKPFIRQKIAESETKIQKIPPEFWEELKRNWDIWLEDLNQQFSGVEEDVLSAFVRYMSRMDSEFQATHLKYSIVNPNFIDVAICQMHESDNDQEKKIWWLTGVLMEVVKRDKAG